jgi:RNA polymerase sigma-70 factor (ECF subfamily)
MLAAVRAETGPPSDKGLLLRFRQGDRSAFGVLYDRYASSLLFFAHSQVGDAALAEDLLQDCFLRLLDLDPAELHHDSVRNLLYAILRNLARDEGRRRSTRLKSYPLLAPSAIAGGEAGPFDDLSLALCGLPPEQREVVVLKSYGELTFAEIAELSGVPEATVKSRYRYAVLKLAEVLRERS